MNFNFILVGAALESRVHRDSLRVSAAWSFLERRAETTPYFICVYCGNGPDCVTQLPKIWQRDETAGAAVSAEHFTRETNVETFKFNIQHNCPALPKRFDLVLNIVDCAFSKLSFSFTSIPRQSKCQLTIDIFLNSLHPSKIRLAFLHSTASQNPGIVTKHLLRQIFDVATVDFWSESAFSKSFTVWAKKWHAHS